jgi:hypothetical protein
LGSGAVLFVRFRWCQSRRVPEGTGLARVGGTTSGRRHLRPGAGEGSFKIFLERPGTFRRVGRLCFRPAAIPSPARGRPSRGATGVFTAGCASYACVLSFFVPFHRDPGRLDHSCPLSRAMTLPRAVDLTSRERVKSCDASYQLATARRLIGFALAPRRKWHSRHPANTKA